MTICGSKDPLLGVEGGGRDREGVRIERVRASPRPPRADGLGDMPLRQTMCGWPGCMGGHPQSIQSAPFGRRQGAAGPGMSRIAHFGQILRTGQPHMVRHSPHGPSICAGSDPAAHPPGHSHIVIPDPHNLGHGMVPAICAHLSMT